MITIPVQLETKWIYIRKTIFRDDINLSTFPKESSLIIELNYYNIIIKPLLKILEKEKIISFINIYNFLEKHAKYHLNYG